MCVLASLSVCVCLRVGLCMDDTVCYQTPPETSVLAPVYKMLHAGITTAISEVGCHATV